MFATIPEKDELTALIGGSLFALWEKLTATIQAQYNAECTWNKGGKAWTYEYKYRIGSKTLCALYAKENCIGFMLIFGKDERAKFEAERDTYSQEVQRVYDAAKTYHDGKWVLFTPADDALFGEFMRLLCIKRKPNSQPYIRESF